MKRILCILTVLCLLVLPALAETAQVSTPEELNAALADDSLDAVEIVADMTYTDVYLYLTKDVTVSANVVFHPAPDDGFFVKSIEIPEGVTLTVNGTLSTEHTFEGGFVIAQVYINGGTLDVSSGTVNDGGNICYNAGTMIAPEGGFADSIAIARYLYENVTEDTLREALAVEELRTVEIQTDCAISGAIEIPEGKTLNVSAILTLNDGAFVTGDIAFAEGCGVILTGSAAINDITVPEGMDPCLVTFAEDGSYSAMPYSAEAAAVTVADWLAAEGACGNCTVTVTIVSLDGDMAAIASDETGEVRLYGLQVDGAAVRFDEAGIQPGDTITLSNPRYNVYEGTVEMTDGTLVP